ncbi:MAG: hypothetical protein GY953_15995, partial [bacterium]|nr:hypothetical protein [bacterium]
LQSASESAETKVSGEEIFLAFVPADGDSVLTTALAKGGAVLESKPLPIDGRPLPATRVMRSEVIKTVMRDGGQEIKAIETGAPGSVDFVPNLPQQKRRRLNGERLAIQFGDGNRIRSFRGIQVATRTQAPPAKDEKAPPPSLTWSTDLLATFDPKSGEVAELQQWGKFRYQEGERQAKADKAVLNAASNRIGLTGKARVWDPMGSTSADVIELDQANDTFVATGRVSSTRLPDSKDDSSGGLLAANEAVHATAHRMVTSDSNRKILYEGDSVLWQGSTRLEAHRVEIDRTTGRLLATGKVLSRLVEEREREPRSVLTVVRANQLVYDDRERLAHYKGSVKLERPAMEVTARELRALLRKDGEKGLDQAFADGEVHIVQQTVERTRTGTAEHAEYYLDEEKVILNGGAPKLMDSLKGTTEGRQLTYYAHDDRLLVDGAEAKPASSRLRRR